MSVSNVNIFELHDENKANEWISWYNIQGPIGFSTADILLFLRTGPSSGISAPSHGPFGRGLRPTLLLRLDWRGGAAPSSISAETASRIYRTMEAEGRSLLQIF